MSRLIDYSKWDHIDTSEDEAEAPQTLEMGQPQQLQQEPPMDNEEHGQSDATLPQEMGQPQQLQQEPHNANEDHMHPDEPVRPRKKKTWY